MTREMAPRPCPPERIVDLRQYDRVWQRVAPTLAPWPGEEKRGPGEDGGMEAKRLYTADAGEAVLPGAERNPCCMGTEAADDLAVLAGFIEEELAEQRQLSALARQAPLWARQTLRELSSGCGVHARRLLAVYYLITGERYEPAVSLDRVYVGKWLPSLRERYHAKACGGMNYERAAEGTADPCLAKVLDALSQDDFRYAADLLRLLERSMDA